MTDLRRKPERLALLRGLYAIADGSARHAPLDLVAAFLRAGASVVQLRLKGRPAAELLELSREAARICRGRALLLVNDRADVAALAGADGVHLGQEDLPVAAARQVVGPEAIIGLSTHSDAELSAALDAGADYVGFGPIYATATKDAPLPSPHGPQGLARAVKRAGALPVVAIGGITVDRAAEVARAGAACAAAIGELCQAADPETRARAMIESFRRGAATHA